MTGDGYELGSRTEVTAGNLSRAEVPGFGEVTSSSGYRASTLQPPTPLSPRSQDGAFVEALGLLEGRGGGRERFQPLRPEFPCRLRASVFLPGIPRVSGLLSAQRCLQGARHGVPAAPKPGAWEPGRRPCRRAGTASRTRGSGAWRCLAARFRSRVRGPAPASHPAPGPRTVRRGARTQGAGLPAARGKVELGEVGSGGGEPRGGQRRAVGSARRRPSRGRDPRGPRGTKSRASG